MTASTTSYRGTERGVGHPDMGENNRVEPKAHELCSYNGDEI